ncbi:MAG: helix-turn-helix domain-containing protein [Hyphomicrobiales bacterium]|nr:helix-turn-helix domain-containing protein [Hyphomicrobiales bacterium]
MPPLDFLLNPDPRFDAVDPRHICCHVMNGSRCEIRDFSMCNVLRGKAVDELEQMARPTNFPPRTPLHEQGAAAHSVFNITAGVVRLSKLLSDGRRQVFGFALPGDFLGLGLPERHAYSADTLTHVTACHFDRGHFKRFMSREPTLLRRLYDLTSRDLAMAQEHIAILGGRNAEEKLACFILGLRTRLVRTVGVLTTIPLPMSRQDIADYLGLTIETVSRTFTRLDREGVLEVARDRVRIVDLPRLETLAAT